MKYIKNIKSVSLLIILAINIFLPVEFIKINNSFTNSQSDLEDHTILKIDSDLSQVNRANSSPPNKTVSGIIDQRDGKIFSNISYNYSNCFINRYNPILNQQPNIYIPGWNLTQALMYFKNISAINYTRDIETETNEFIQSDENNATYVYQKFSVEISQYINNVSIFIQDINNPLVYNDENSWEVAILNCANDTNGTPDKELGKLIIPHPFNIAAHWELFNFSDSVNGSVFLDVSKTNYTIDEEENKKFWFTIRIKIPPDDEQIVGLQRVGGPKFLYMNPDGGNYTNIGIGDTFKKYYTIYYENITLNNVRNFTTINNDTYSGNVDSFSEIDEDRYFTSAETNNLTIWTTFDIKNLTSGIPYQGLRSWILAWPDLWNYPWVHPLILYSVDLYIMTNISKKLDSAKLYVRDYYNGVWENLSKYIDINQANETFLHFKFKEPDAKQFFIFAMNLIDGGKENILDIKLEYNDTGDFDVSINQIIINMSELKEINDTILLHDPQIMELYFPNNVTVENGTTPPFEPQYFEDLRLNDDIFYRARAYTNNLSIEFKFNILSQLDSALWEVDMYDYFYFYPNPIIPKIDLRISSNVSIDTPLNLSIAVLEIYKGDKELPFLSNEQNLLDWIQISEDNKSFANVSETQVVQELIWPFNWLALQFINASDQNSVKFRLRYVANGSLEEFNVSIDEFSLVVYVQNVISSDITCKLGLGLDSSDLKPSDIKMKNFGIDIEDYLDGIGIWENASFSTWENVSFGIPSQGYFYFNVTSKWNSITFDVEGIYQIEKYYDFQWNYYLINNSAVIQWNITSNIQNYHIYTIIGSRGLQINIPAEWQLLKIYDNTDSEVLWNWTLSTIGLLNLIKVYGISEGNIKIEMNSPITSINIVYNATNNVKIDRNIQIFPTLTDTFGGDLTFQVFDSQLNSILVESVNLDTPLGNSHVFIWDIFDTTQEFGTYYLKTSWIKYNQTHAFISLESKVIRVSKYQTKLEFLNLERYVNNSIFGTEIIIVGNLTNTETSAPIERETIMIEIHSENGIIDMLTGITDDEGIIREDYTLPEDFNWISMKLVYNQTDSYYDTTESGEMIRINLISQGQYVLNIFLTFLPYIALIGAVIAGTLTVRHQRLSKLRKKWAKDTLVLDDLLKISYIMIILKDSGVSVYSKMLAAEEIQPDLISGFLHAIAQFKREIKRDALEVDVSKGFEMDYGDFKIVITDGKFARVAFVLEETPSAQLKERQTSFTWEFERKFEPYLIEFTGDLTPFNEADDLIEKYFNPSLTYPLKLGKYAFVMVDSGKLTSLETALLEVAEQMQKEKKFFFVSSLLSYGLAGRKESRDQIISSILSLKAKGILEPYEFEQ